MSIGVIFACMVGVIVLLSVSLLTFSLIAARHAERVAPPMGRYVQIDGARLHYIDRGTGPVLVMVHGLAGNLRNFYELIDRLSVDHRVIALDRPGCGYSVMKEGQHPGMHAQAVLMAQFIRWLKLDRPTVVGHSMGGALALALAIAHPDCVGALMLIAPLSNIERTPPRGLKILRIQSRLNQWLIAWMFSEPISALIHRRSLKAVFAPEPVVSGFDTLGGGVLGPRPWSFAAACKDMVAISREMASLPPHYSSLTIPVNILFGRQDAVLKYETHGEKTVSLFQQGSLQLIEGGGHMILVTQPDRVAQWIREARYG